MEPCDLLEQYRSHRFHELPGQIGFRNPVYYGQELGVIWNTLDILYKYCIAKLLSVSDAFDAWLEAKTGRDKIAAQIQNVEKKFCE